MQKIDLINILTMYYIKSIIINTISIMNTNITHIIIDNCVVSCTPEYSLCIRSLSLENKLNPSLNLDELVTVTTGSRQSDAKLIRDLSDGKVVFQDIIKM